MMLKTKRRKNLTLGAPWTILKINSMVQKLIDQKRVWDISTGDP